MRDNNIFNIFCDESCHLISDKSKTMGFGALSIEENKKKKLVLAIRDLAEEFGYSRFYEYKWTKIAPCNVQLYLKLVDLFFDDNGLKFRAWIVNNKDRLQINSRAEFDDFYYKMYFYLLNYLIDNSKSYNIYLDYKDTRGGLKVKRLKDVLANAHYDYFNQIIKQIQLVESKQVSLVQLCDVLLGAVTSCNRGIELSEAKQKVIDRIRERSGLTLINKTGRFNRFNIFIMEVKRGDIDELFKR